MKEKKVHQMKMQQLPWHKQTCQTSKEEQTTKKKLLHKPFINAQSQVTQFILENKSYAANNNFPFKPIFIIQKVINRKKYNIWIEIGGGHRY